MNRASLFALAAFLFAAAMIGCGGGGSGGGTTGTTGTTGTSGSGGSLPVPGQYLEFVGLTRLNEPLDPLNLQVGDQIQCTVSNYDGVGNRTVLNASGFTVVGAGSGFVSITPQGRLTITGNPGGFFQIQAVAVINGSTRVFSQDCFIPTATTVVTGKVLATGTNAPVDYVQVEFFEGANRVGGALTMKGGNFAGRVPATATRFSIKASTIPNTVFYRGLRYASRNYTVSDVTCLAPLPNLTAGVSNPLAANPFIPRIVDGPPPPPDGCGS